MNAQPNRAAPRKRRPPQRRVATVLEHRPQQPFIFGWGAHLNRHEREALKERIALFGGIVLAAVLVLILGWGWYQDNVSRPAAVRAANNKAVAQIGKYTVRMGYFKRLEKFRENTVNNQIQQLQQQLASLQADPKKNALQIGQMQSQLQVMQQQLGTLPTNTLDEVINDQTVLQRSSTAGVPLRQKDIQKAMKQAQTQAGGPKHLQTFVDQSGMTRSEFQDLVVAENYLQPKIQAKLAASVKRYQTKVRASHILIPTAKKSLAEKLYHEVLKGANFATLAKKYSQDPGSAKKGGDLGYFAHGTMVAPFDKAAFSMKVGQIRLVKSTYGWHIIKVTDRKRSRLTDTELQQAQQSAYQSWLVKEQNLAPVRRFLDPTKLPGLPLPTPVLPATSGQSSTGLPSQLPNQLPQQPAPRAAQPKTGKNASQPAKPNTGKSSTKSSTTKKP